MQIDREKTMIFDRLHTADGHEVYWLHQDGDNKIDPDDLYCDKYNFMDACEHIVTDGRPFLNYAIEEDVIAEWEEERYEIAQEYI